MKKFLFFIAFGFLFFVVTSMVAFLVLPPAFVGLHGHSRKIPSDFDYGSWTGSTYKNDFFGFSITIPENWHISEKDEMKALRKVGRDQLQNANLLNEKEMKRVDKITEITTANLFQVLRYSAEEAAEKEESNPNIQLSAEKVPGNINQTQYVKVSRQNLTKVSPNHVVKSEMNKMLDGLEFTSLEMEFEVYGVPIYQQQLICLKNGFAVYFTLTWVDDSDKEQLDAVMATLTWK